MDEESGFKQYRKPKQGLFATVEEYVTTPDVPTACAMSPDGQFAVCGLFNGTVFFYRADTMRYFTQISCRNRRGRHREGRKVTGLVFRPLGKEEEEEESKRRSLSGRRSIHFLSNRNGGRKYHLLVSTNDNRLRLYDTGSFNQVGKFKGFTCEDLQLRASFSSNGSQIISASEDGKIYVWSTFYGGQRNNGPDDVDGSPVRTFRRNSVLSKTTNEGYEWFRVESASSGGGESEGSGSSSTSCICTTATFAPIPAVAALEEAYGGEFYDPQALPPQPEDDEPSSGRAILSLDEWSSERAKATRILVVGDYDGVLHVFARGSYSDLL
uniref:Anaphase-promoting complex subunit 4 WD40 domain-containing protein n=2 Tax=Pinguiococcus pyrenoidosus TaxID=172671 RepID=A0A7R9YF60_9STRA